MIYVVAYLAKNLGDDLFIQTLLRRYPNQKFYICSSKDVLIAFGDEDNLTCNNSCFQKYLAFKHKIKNGGRGRVRNNKIMQSADAIVHIGGSIFIENENWKSNFKPEYNENIFYIGANFGPYKSEEYRMEIESRLKATNDCCFRDSYSYNLFSKLKNTRWAPDVIFGYPFFPSYKKGDKIGISVIDYSFRNCAEGIQKKYENGIIKICNYYQALGKEILLLGFCNAEGDGIAIDRIKNKMQNIQNISWINYHGKIEEFIDALNECETIFATRFHAMILGWSMRKKVVPIVYSPKQIHVLQDLKYEGTIWNIMNGEEISDSCVCAENCELDDEILRKCIEKSQEQFRALDEFIESNARDDRER